MTNVGALISTQGGLRTVVQVLPGHVDPMVANVVTEPLGGNADASQPPEFLGTPLPGQAQSSATFVQTMVFPADSASSDSASASSDQSAASQSQATAPQATNTTGTDWPDATPSSSSDQGNSSAVNASTNGSPASNNAAPQASQAFSQAATAYQAAQQRSGGNTQHSVIVG